MKRGAHSDNNQVKAFAFDLGNVLLPFDVTVALRRLAEQGEGGPAAVAALFYKDDLAKRFEMGKISGAQFYEVFQRDLKYRGSYEEFSDAFSDIFSENAPMIALVRELKRRFPVYLLSNTNEIHVGFIDSRFSFMREFNGHFYSYIEGVAKPDSKYYRLFMGRHGYQPAEIAFVDDLLLNVEGARAVGMRAVHYQEAQQARNELLQLAGEV